MGETRIRADGGPRGRTERVAAIAERLGTLEGRIEDAAFAGDDAGVGGVELQPDEAPSPPEYADDDAYLRDAHAWATEEFLAAVSDLEHRTLELQRAVEAYPGLGDDRRETSTYRDAVLEDLADVASAVERLVLAAARLSRIEAAYAAG